MVTKDTFIRGSKNGIHTVLMLAKIILPVYFIVTVLKYTGILEYIAIIFEPVMDIFGLPGEAALALVLGNALNIYAALGVISSISLTAKQITILAVMISFSHTLFVETAVTKKIGIGVLPILATRIGLAIASGVILNLVL
ncbi:MAG: nucleoside recognition protein [Clostridiales bacterium]|nr:nucleoside recognition protein [Clostridiales bacterium]